MANPPATTKTTPYTISEWQEGEPIPPGYHPVQRLRRRPIIAGAIVLGVFYFISTLAAAGQHDSSNGQNTSDAWLYAPVAGPFITMARTWSSVANVMLFIDGAAQTAGAALLVWGITSPQTVLAHNDYLATIRVTARPLLLGRDGAGLGLVGAF